MSAPRNRGIRTVRVLGADYFCLVSSWLQGLWEIGAFEIVDDKDVDSMRATLYRLLADACHWKEIRTWSGKGCEIGGRPWRHCWFESPVALDYSAEARNVFHVFEH